MFKHIILKITSSPIGKRMATGMFWSFSGSALAKIITLLAGIACAHILRKEMYGQFCMVRSTINMFVIFGAGGLGVTATKYISEYRKDKEEEIPFLYLTTKTFGLFTGIFCTLLIIIFSNYIATNILHQSSLSLTLKIGSILLFLSILNGVQNGALTGFEDFKSIAKNTLAGSISETMFMLLGAYFYGINGAILGFGIGFITIYICNKLSIARWYKYYKISFASLKHFRRSNLRLLYHYSLPAAFSAILITPVFFLLRSMLVRNYGFGELAVFEAADQWKVIILFIPTTISQIVLPILSSLQQESKTFFKTLKINILIIGCISIFISIPIYFTSSFVMRAYGEDFVNPLPLQILTISTVFSSVAHVLEMAIYSLGKIWDCLVINSIWALTATYITYLLLHQGLKAEALSLGILAAYLLSCMLYSGYIWYLSNQKIAAL